MFILSTLLFLFYKYKYAINNDIKNYLRKQLFKVSDLNEITPNAFF